MVAAKRGGKRIGYVRVSSVDQNTARQLDGIELDKVFTDKVSGKDTNRPQLKAALDGSGANLCEGHSKASGGVKTMRRVPHSRLPGQLDS